jgi:hypothetical protein
MRSEYWFHRQIAGEDLKSPQGKVPRPPDGSYSDGPANKLREPLDDWGAYVRRGRTLNPIRSSGPRNRDYGDAICVNKVRC